MFSGRDPGELGLYGFSHRIGPDPQDLTLPDATRVPHPRLWDLASAAALDSVVVGVPQTWPPPEESGPFRGALVSGLLCPGRELPCTTPRSLVAELPEGYAFDVEDFRHKDASILEAELHAMTRARFDLFRSLISKRPWSLGVMVEIGLDRMHHVFWKEGMERIERYYQALDDQIRQTIELVDQAGGPPTTIMVVSDHGAQTLQGGVRLNQWLLDEGLLVLREPLETGKAVALTPEMIDWSRTQAVGQGGYCGRVSLNLRGRQTQGIVLPEVAEGLLSRITIGLKSLGEAEATTGSGPLQSPGEGPRAWATEVLRPRDLYREERGFPPDLIVYFDALRLRALGSVGGPIFDSENDSGPDGANHAKEGIFIMSALGESGAAQETDQSSARGPRQRRPQGRLEGLTLYDVFATTCAQLGLSAPRGQSGPPPWGG